MAALNEAYEVLSNAGERRLVGRVPRETLCSRCGPPAPPSDLRARFDQGDDPNDPSGGHGHGGNPFAHHGAGQGFQQFFQQGGQPFMFQGGGGQQRGQKMQFQWG